MPERDWNPDAELAELARRVRPCGPDCGCRGTLSDEGWAALVDETNRARAEEDEHPGFYPEDMGVDR